jgi:DNA-directed RNA polymerase beta' subunit
MWQHEINGGDGGRDTYVREIKSEYMYMCALDFSATVTTRTSVIVVKMGRRTCPLFQTHAES